MKMPGSEEWWGAFRLLKVLEVQDLGGKVLERNYYLCTECGQLRNTKIDGSEYIGDGKFRTHCTCENCGYHWAVRH